LIQAASGVHFLEEKERGFLFSTFLSLWGKFVGHFNFFLGAFLP
jgi:hypothetical protein